jgi:putative tricarboxylic transport membrane protein
MVTRESFFQKLNYVFRTVFPKQIIVFSGIIILYMILLVPLHFLVSSFLFLIVSMVYFLGLKFAKSAIPLSAIVLFVIYVIFHYIFRIVLP